METVGYLTDVIGPRLTASPQMKRANAWTRDTMAGWGLENAHLEAWGPFGRGWELERFCAQVVEPQCIPLIALPKAWSPGTDGPLVAPVVYLDAESPEDLEEFRGRLKGAIVLTGKPRDLAAHFEAQGRRLDEKDLLELANAAPPGEGGGPRRGGDRSRSAEFQARMAEFRRQAQFRGVRDRFLLEEGVALIAEPSPRGDGGTLFVQSASVPRSRDGSPGQQGAHPWDEDATTILPQIVLANEHYNRLVRMLRQGEAVTMEVDLRVTFHDDDPMGYNTVAEIPGSDPELKDEVVMLGGHLDSWHGGTGATDNAAGCAVAMEAARIIRALDLKPRRTIRVALWSGEEQGLFGSRAYVAEHFGGREELPPAVEYFGRLLGLGLPRRLETKPEYDAFCGYFNYDNGTGKIRGVYMEGNEAVRPIFRRWLGTLADLGATTLTAAPTGGTDHQSFDAIGLPGFQFIQDPVEYESRTHHSNMDLYDRLQADDLKQASVVMAAFVLNAANADEKLPRKPLPAAGR